MMNEDALREQIHNQHSKGERNGVYLTSIKPDKGSL